MSIKRIFIAVFCLGLLVPAVGQMAGLKGVLPGENRAAARSPAFPKSANELRSFPRQINAWVEDNFGFRSTILLVGRALEKKLAIPPKGTSLVLEGKDGWMFYTADKALEDYMGRRKYGSSSEATLQLQQIVETVDYLSSKGAQVVFAVPPNKMTVYPEFMLDAVPHKPDDTRLSELSALAGDTIPEWLDLLSAMTTAKSEGRLYYQHDTHWNDLGAYHAYRQIMARFSLTPLSMEQLNRAQAERTNGDLLRMLGREGQVTEVAETLKPKAPIKVSSSGDGRYDFMSFKGQAITTMNSEAPTLLLIGDSFSDALMPFLEQHFSRIVKIHHQYGAFDPGVLDAYPSDYVLVEVVERGLQQDWQSPTIR